MQVEMNVRGNGACPICTLSGGCFIQESIKETFEDFTGKEEPEETVELVIYTCPYFVEKS
jgi:hypothetical protein